MVNFRLILLESSAHHSQSFVNRVRFEQTRKYLTEMLFVLIALASLVSAQINFNSEMDVCINKLDDSAKACLSNKAETDRIVSCSEKTRPSCNAYISPSLDIKNNKTMIDCLCSGITVARQCMHQV